MKLTEEQLRGLDLSINESQLLGFEIDPQARVGYALFRVLTLPETGPAPDDRRVWLIFRPVGRVCAALWKGYPGFPDSKLISFPIDDLLGMTRSLGAAQIYGEAFDLDEEDLSEWDEEKLSLDWESGPEGRTHSISLFPGGNDLMLSLCVWFDDLEIRWHDDSPCMLEEFIRGGRRWWDALSAGDPRSEGFGIFPGGLGKKE